MACGGEGEQPRPPPVDLARDGGGDPAPPLLSRWEQQVVTDASWLVDGSTAAVAVPAGCLPSGWARLHPAQWIWRAPCAAEDRETRLFLKRFVIPGIPDVAELDVLVDNYAFVSINDQILPNDCTFTFGPRTYGPAAVCSFLQSMARDVRALLRPGENVIRIMVHNAPIEATGDWGNPAGLLVRLTMTSGASR
jgi:hypothetical protein